MSGDQFLFKLRHYSLDEIRQAGKVSKFGVPNVRMIFQREACMVFLEACQEYYDDRLEDEE